MTKDERTAVLQAALEAGAGAGILLDASSELID